MKKSQSIYITNSLKARESLFTNKLIPANKKASVTKWLNSASDEDIEALAIDSGWNADTIITSKDIVVADAPASEMRTVIDSNGDTQSVEIVNLTFLRATPKKNYNKNGWDGTFVLAFFFKYGSKTVKTHSKLLARMRKNGELVKGDTFPFKMDSITLTHVPANGNTKGYSFYEGATLEASVEAMEDTRAILDARELALAGMSKAAQLKIADVTADAEIKAFHEEFGL
jgi:hypothetical protein